VRLPVSTVLPYYKKSRETILSRALRLAKLAMAGAPRGTVFGRAPVAAGAAGAPDVLAELATAALGPLGRLPEEERQELAGTLRTWLACGGSAEATAKILSCHPSTVRYRLNRALQPILCCCVADSELPAPQAPASFEQPEGRVPGACNEV
jgi:hypothetical protein